MQLVVSSYGLPVDLLRERVIWFEYCSYVSSALPLDFDRSRLTGSADVTILYCVISS